jgi:hypothetical protein
MRPQTKYVRTRKGQMIHLSSCPKLSAAKNIYPWSWAETVPGYRVKETAWFFDYQTCRHCKPLDGISMTRID